MTSHILILGGRGRIGTQVARDLLENSPNRVTVTGYQKTPSSNLIEPLTAHGANVLQLDLADREALTAAIAQADLVIHCAGPFLYRDGRVLQECIAQGVPYLDVSDSVEFTRTALAHHEAAQRAGVTAIINSGVFPGISNSMVRQCVEQFDQPEEIFLGYVVGGSGGAGVTVMRTTFLGLQRPFKAWIDGQWQEKLPYSDRQPVQFPSPFGQVGVYWYEVPETYTLVKSFPVKTVVTKFGSVPDFYNYLTWIVARWFPKFWLQRPQNIEFLAQVSHRMTRVSDRFSGIGIGIEVNVKGYHNGQLRHYGASLLHDDTAIAAGIGTGTLAQMMLDGTVHQPGVHPVEQILSTPLFEQAMASRNIHIQHGWRSP
ncbi:MAG: saccharopine dehydrogenase NADP-binding domain-containing protein [Synechococcales bacterium]|nr:saccharopine dehydrogenase NADP-binding domain-containing protein [Synechococcales bacterium]